MPADTKYRKDIMRMLSTLATKAEKLDKEARAGLSLKCIDRQTVEIVAIATNIECMIFTLLREEGQDE